ncbi:MAG: adenylate cyclase [Solirubrobacteraceae bacterium]|nr:adenylate cyclase [Solirubrobacteraceae bacterium]
MGNVDLPVEEMEIGAAHPAREHAEQHLAWLWGGDGPLDELQRSAHRLEHHRAHYRIYAHMEIERKFLIRDPPPDRERYPCTRIEQAYVAIDPAGTEVRIRRREGETSLTVKGGRGRARAEEEVEIDGERFARLWELAAGRSVEKRRYQIPTDDALTIELDVYDGDLAGLVVAEVEFPSEEAAERYEPPFWFGAEVTDDDAYKNRRLAVDGRPREG